MSWALDVAFNENVAGVFTLESALDGPDTLSDLGAFAGTFDSVEDDVTGSINVTTGTDTLAGSTQASSLTATVARPDDPGYWNPNNPDSPLNGFEPGFQVMRPGRLIESTEDGTMYGVFYGFLRRATWSASTRSCELYFEDLLFRASRVYPTIFPTGPTTTGAVIGLILDAMGWPWPQWRQLAVGDALDNFTADGTESALSLFSDLLTAERGTVFVRGDGVFVYESRDMPLSRPVSATFSTAAELSECESGIDADSVLTRASVTKTDPSGDTEGTNWTAMASAVFEQRVGRSDWPAISSPYIPAAGGQNLADDLVFQGVTGKPPVLVTVTAIDDDTLATILSSPLQSVFEIDDPLGGTAGVFIVQRAVHTIDVQHHVDYTLTKRIAASYTLDSALDGPDVFRY